MRLFLRTYKMMIGWMLICTCTSIASTALAARSELRVSELSTVRVGDPIRLKVLLTDNVQDEDLAQKISQLVVLDSINAEETKSFQSEELALILRRKLSFTDLQKLSIKIPETFRLKAVRNYIYPADIQEQIKQKAQNFCTQCEIVFDDLKIPEIKNSLDMLGMQLDTTGIRGAGGFLLPLKISTSQGVRNLWINGKLSFYKMAPVAKRLIQSNERIDASDFEMKKTNISFAKDAVVEDLKALTAKGLMAGKILNIGDVLYSADLKKEPAAKRGQAVKLLIGNDTFEVTANGVAEESGVIGDMIKVKNVDNAKILSGILVEKGTVRIQ